MNNVAFGLMAYKDADSELQKQYPGALFFLLSRSNLNSFVLFDQRELLMLNMHRQNSIRFERQEDDYLGQVVFVGKLAIFERKINDDQTKKQHCYA